MTVLRWPEELKPVSREAICAELESLVEQVINEEMHALDTLDDKFARMAAALLALLRAHRPDFEGGCVACPPEANLRSAGCELVETVHQYLKQPLTLVWWHVHNDRGEPMRLDEVGAWIAASATPHNWCDQAAIGEEL